MNFPLPYSSYREAPNISSSYMSVQICRDSYTYVCISISIYVYTCVLVVQSCLTLWDPMDCSLSGSSVHGILQARILDWVAIPFSKGSSQPRSRTQVSCTAGRFFIIWVTREAHLCLSIYIFISPSPFSSLLSIQMVTFHLSHSGSFFFSSFNNGFQRSYQYIISFLATFNLHLELFYLVILK